MKKNTQEQEQTLNYFSRNSKKNKKVVGLNKTFMRVSKDTKNEQQKGNSLVLRSIKVKSRDKKVKKDKKQESNVNQQISESKRNNVKQTKKDIIINLKKQQKFSNLNILQQINKSEFPQIIQNQLIETKNVQTLPKVTKNQTTFFRQYLTLDPTPSISPPSLSPIPLPINLSPTPVTISQPKLSNHIGLANRLSTLWNTSTQINLMKTKKYQSMISQLIISVQSTRNSLREYHSKASTSLEEIQLTLRKGKEYKDDQE